MYSLIKCIALCLTYSPFSLAATYSSVFIDVCHDIALQSGNQTSSNFLRVHLSGRGSLPPPLAPYWGGITPLLISIHLPPLILPAPFTKGDRANWVPRKYLTRRNNAWIVGSGTIPFSRDPFLTIAQSSCAEANAWWSLRRLTLRCCLVALFLSQGVNVCKSSA